MHHKNAKKTHQQAHAKTHPDPGGAPPEQLRAAYKKTARVAAATNLKELFDALNAAETPPGDLTGAGHDTSHEWQKESESKYDIFKNTYDFQNYEHYEIDKELADVGFANS